MTTAELVPFVEAFCESLNGLLPGWRVEDGVIRGPGAAAVRLCERHEEGKSGHVDVEFSFTDSVADALRLWDCVSGFGDTESERALAAAHLWCGTTAGALLEFKFSRTGEFADHYHGRDAGGLSGWHCICGAIMGYGRGGSADILQDWWLSQNAVLPALSPALSDLPGDRPHAIKIFFGGDDIAEVRVDGEFHEAASATLLALPWPRLTAPGFVRAFVIALHRE